LLSLSTDSLAAGAPAAPAAGAPPPSNVPRAHGDDRFDRIFKTLSGEPAGAVADADAADDAANADAGDAAAAGAAAGPCDVNDGRASLTACFLKAGKFQESKESNGSKRSKESGESQASGEAGKSEEAAKSGQAAKSGETGKGTESGKGEKCGAPNTAMGVDLLPITPPVAVPQPIADPANPHALAGDAAESGHTANKSSIDEDSSARGTSTQGMWKDALSGRKVADGRAGGDSRASSTATRAAGSSADTQASIADRAGRFNALDGSIDADGAAEATTGDGAAAQIADAASRQTPRSQPTAADLRVAAGISNDLRAAIRGAGGNAGTGGPDTGASADRGSRGASSSAGEAQHFAAAPADVKAAVDAVQMAARAAGPISPDLLTAPHLQNVVRAPSLEAAAAVALDRDGASVSSQVIESLRLQWTKGGGDAQMTLQPGYLGGLSVSLRVDKDVVTASVIAESPAVREWLRANESSLRQGLVDVGLRLDKFQVSDLTAQTPSRDTDARDRPSGRDRQHAPRQPKPGRSDSTFEVIAE
jgi:chemotaxis protein MotD